MVYPSTTGGAFDDETVFGHFEPDEVIDTDFFSHSPFRFDTMSYIPSQSGLPSNMQSHSQRFQSAPMGRMHSSMMMDDRHSTPDLEDHADDDTIIDSVKDIATFHKRHLKERYPNMPPERRENIWRLVTLHRSAKYRREKYRQDPEWRGKLINNAKEFRARKERSHSRKSVSQDPDSSSSETSPSRQPRTPEPSYAQQHQASPTPSPLDASYLHSQLASHAAQDYNETKPVLYDLPEPYYYQSQVPEDSYNHIPMHYGAAGYSSMPRQDAKGYQMQDFSTYRQV